MYRLQDAIQTLRLHLAIKWLELRNRFGWRQVATGKHGPAVSLTTHGRRFKTVYLAIESIARGEMLPARLILWIDDATSLAKLPKTLQRLKRRGLEIRLSNNYGPHTKYYPYVEGEATFVGPLVTADDDVLYPCWWLSRLMASYNDYPDCVSCYRARVVRLHDEKIAPYREWEMCSSTWPNYRTFATGVSGVIYPSALLEQLKLSGADFMVCCPTADDVWLHVQTLRRGCKIRQIQPLALHFPVIPGTQEEALSSINWSHGNGNDRQVATTYAASDVELMKCSSVQPTEH